MEQRTRRQYSVLSSNSLYEGLPLCRGRRFESWGDHPLYRFPLWNNASTADQTRMMSKDCFTHTEGLNIYRTIELLAENSPFTPGETPSTFKSFSSYARDLAPQDNSEAKCCETSVSQLSLSFRTDESPYTHDEFSGIDWEGHAKEGSLCDASHDLNVASFVLELLRETDQSISLFRTHNESSLEISDDDGNSSISRPSTRVFLNGATASKSRLLVKNGTCAVLPPDCASPVLRKLVICQEAPTQIVESRENSIELTPVEILFSIPTCGFATALALEFSSESARSRALIQYSTDSLLISLLPAPILKGFSALRINWLSCGFEHCAAVLDSGGVLTWGYGASGCLGHNSYSTMTRPTLIPTLVNVVYLECGAYHTAAVDTEKDLWVWGRGDVHQLGLPLSSLHSDWIGHVALAPKQVTQLAREIKSVACGEAHTLALTQDGKVHCFGWAVEGQLGVPQPTGVCTTEIAQLKLPFAVLKVSAGLLFSACINEKGEIYVWGNGEQGQLGLGPKIKHSEYPALVGFFRGDFIVELVCGENSVICMNKSGQVYGWGRGLVGEFNDSAEFPRDSEILCCLPRQLGHIEIAHRCIVPL